MKNQPHKKEAWEKQLDYLLDDMGDYEWDSRVKDEVWVEGVDRKRLKKFIRNNRQQLINEVVGNEELKEDLMITLNLFSMAIEKEGIVDTLPRFTDRLMNDIITVLNNIKSSNK